MRKISKEFAVQVIKTGTSGMMTTKTLPKNVANFLDNLTHKNFEESQVHLFLMEGININISSVPYIISAVQTFLYIFFKNAS